MQCVDGFLFTPHKMHMCLGNCTRLHMYTCTHDDVIRTKSQWIAIPDTILHDNYDGYKFDAHKKATVQQCKTFCELETTRFSKCKDIGFSFTYAPETVFPPTEASLGYRRFQKLHQHGIRTIGGLKSPPFCTMESRQGYACNRHTYRTSNHWL